MNWNNLKYTTGILLALLLSACYKDQGNYDYTDPNRVLFAGIKDSYMAMQGEYFEIIPQLNFTDTAALDSARYTYEWISLKSGVVNLEKRKDLGKNLSLRMNM